MIGVGEHVNRLDAFYSIATLQKIFRIAHLGFRVEELELSSFTVSFVIAGAALLELLLSAPAVSTLALNWVVCRLRNDRVLCFCLKRNCAGKFVARKWSKIPAFHGF